MHERLAISSAIVSCRFAIHIVLQACQQPTHYPLATQVVAFQAMMEMMAQQFPGAFSGYNLAVTESHQVTKADTSGTAKAVVASLQKLGLDFSEVMLCLHIANMHVGN